LFLSCSLLLAHFGLATLVSLTFLKHIRHAIVLSLLHRLFPLPESLFLQKTTCLPPSAPFKSLFKCHLFSKD
jgi:hypothetical protein